MTRTLVLMLLPILLMSGLFAIPRIIPTGNAARIGEVCIANNGSTSCPISPPLINSTGPPAPQLRVAIAVNESDGINGFDITLLANSTFLKPAGIDLTGSVLLGAPTVVLECIGVKLITGTVCSSTDTPNTLHLAVATAELTFAPTTGLLFTAIYNVTGNTYNTPIKFQTGCSGTSVIGGVCVTALNGSPTPPQETVQTAKYSNRPYFDLQPFLLVPSPLTILDGGTVTALDLNVTSINDFSGTVNLSVATVNSTGPTVFISPTTAKVNVTVPEALPQVTIHVPQSLPGGTYLLNFTGTSGSIPPNALALSVIVPSPDFKMTSSSTPRSIVPNSVTFNVSNTGSFNVTLSSFGNFSGIVNLNAQSSAGLMTSISRPNVKIPPCLGGACSSTYNWTIVTVNSTLPGIYAVNLTATSGSITHSVTLTATVVDFLMSLSSTAPLTIAQGSSGSRQVFFSPAGSGGQPIGLFNTTVTISGIYVTQITSKGPVGPSTGITVQCSPKTVDMFYSGPSEQPVPTTCAITGNVAGDYTVTVIGTGGSDGHTASRAVSFPVIVVLPDFTISSSTAVQVVSVGNTATINVTLIRPIGSLGLNSSVSMIASFPPLVTSAPTVLISPKTVMINSTYPNATAIVTITTNGSTPTGTYYLTIQASSTTPVQVHSVTIAIVVTTTQSPHDLEVYSVKASSTSATVGSNINITIVVMNVGKLPENSTVLALVGNLSVGNQTFVSLQPGANMTFTITWHTSSYTAGSYTIAGQVLGVPGQTDLGHNIQRLSIPVELTAPSGGLLSSGYVEPTIIIVLVALLAIALVLMLQSRRKKPSQTTTN